MSSAVGWASSRAQSRAGAAVSGSRRRRVSDRHFQVGFEVLAALRLEALGVGEGLAAGTALVELGHVLVEHLDGGVNLAVQVGLMAQDFVQFVQALVLSERAVLEDLGLPAVESAETPGGGGDLFDVVLFEEALGLELCAEFLGDLPVAFGVFAEVGEDDVTGEEAVRGGVARGERLAGGGARAGGVGVAGAVGDMV